MDGICKLFLCCCEATRLAVKIAENKKDTKEAVAEYFDKQWKFMTK